AIAIPPNNDVDVFANDIGLIAIIENNTLKGFNIAIGGGLSTTHGNPETYPRLATVIGFTNSEEKTLSAVYEILTVQRDYGNRSDRKLARLKYTVDRLGIEAFKKEVERRTGFIMENERPYYFHSRGDYYGWEQNHEGLWYYTVFVENGRVLDDEHISLKSGLLEVAKTGKATFRFTANQNVIISDIQPGDKEKVDIILRKYKIIEHTDNASPVRKNAMACVAFPTCPLALAEAQRYMPSLVTKIEGLLDKFQLADEAIIIRMTGCPNGCARSYLAEVGFVGTALGKYNMHLGGDHEGKRLNKIYKESVEEGEILHELEILFSSFKHEKAMDEKFGDYVIRKQFV
ncbi:MAG TPA: NADPH-dependent assimilatory sulfite reductase hemoprotein subunit, partial [Ferruginibacter sp.]|nr:NADPH-dependent assimilatory sulfite reductase hemoprotein subunit [Ferruginibacter sp.]